MKAFQEVFLSTVICYRIQAAAHYTINMAMQLAIHKTSYLLQ